MPIADGEKIRKFREDAGFSQTDLAERGEISRATIRRAEDGFNVTITSIRAIAHALSIARGRDVTAQSITVDHTSIEKSIVDISPSTEPHKLRKILAERGITQKEVAYETEISQAHLSAVLAGKRRLRPDVAARILDFLDNYPRDFPTFEFERVESTPVIWNDDKSARLKKLKDAADTIPNQNPLVRFGISDNAKLNLIPTLAEENDYDTIEALRSELLAVQGPIELLKERYAKSPNVPQAGLFGPLASKYAEELSKDLKDINYTVLYARGSRFYAARRRASQQIESGEWPELDADENEAIDAICDLHGPMIMASAAGRKLVEDAHQYEVPPEVYEEDQKTIEEFGQVIAAETELVEPETAEAYRELTAKTEGDPQPARSRGLGMAATGSALTVVVGGAAWYGAGGAVATFIVPATALGAAGLVGGFFWEAIKTMPRFKKATNTVGDQFEKAIDKAEKHADEKERALLKGMADLVERKRPLFEKVANLRPEFGWAKKFISKPNDQPKKEPLDLGDVLRSASSELLKRAHREGIKITEARLHEKSIILGDPGQLQNAFRNLMINAAQNIGAGKASGKEIELKITAIDFASDTTPGTFIVSVHDNGTGIRSENLPRIFDQGFREAVTPAGMGYGLFITRQIIEEHGGSIRVNSEFGSGTEFLVSLPAHNG
jgi:transcriptional regulator with XRE-family HTH domain